MHDTRALWLWSSFLYLNLVFVWSYRLLHILHLNLGYCYSSRRGSILILRCSYVCLVVFQATCVYILSKTHEDYGTKWIRMSIHAGNLLGAPIYLHAKPAYLVMGLWNSSEATDWVGGKVRLTEAVLFHCNSHTRMCTNQIRLSAFWSPNSIPQLRLQHCARKVSRQTSHKWMACYYYFLKPQIPEDAAYYRKLALQRCDDSLEKDCYTPARWLQ